VVVEIGVLFIRDSHKDNVLWNKKAIHMAKKKYAVVGRWEGSLRLAAVSTASEGASMKPGLPRSYPNKADVEKTLLVAVEILSAVL
jgi:hypothetical protein